MEGSELVRKATEFNDRLSELAADLLLFYDDVDTALRTRAMKRPDECDLGFLLRTIQENCEEIRKEAKARMEFSGRIIAYEITVESLQTNSVETVQGNFCSAWPTVSQVGEVPSKNSPAFKEFCKSLGIDTDIAEKGIVKFSYTGLSEWITQKIQEGQKVPEGVKSRPEYKMIYRRKVKS